MLVQTSISDEKTPLPLQVETDQAASSQDVASQRRARFFWTGLGVASLMLMMTACLLVSHASVEPARLAPEVASFNSMPALGSRGIRRGMVYTPASLPHIRMAANPHLPPLDMSLAAATPIHQSSVYTQESDFLDGKRIPPRGTSGRLLEAVVATVQKEVDIDGYRGGERATIQWQQCNRRQQYSGNSFYERRMRVQMLAALREELLLAGVPAPKKRLCVFDFDGTLTNNYAPRGETLGDATRIADLREFLETLHADAHIVVCSLNDQHHIVNTLRAANLLDLFDIVVDAYHMIPFGPSNKGRALNELLLPLFPSVGGPGDVLFVDDNAGKIREVKVSVPACKTFMCSSYGLSSDDMRFLLDGGSNVEMSEGIRKADADYAKALWEGGDAGVKRLWLRESRELLKNAIQAEGSDTEANLKDLRRAIERSSE